MFFTVHVALCEPALSTIIPLHHPPSPVPRDASEGTLLQTAALSCGGCVAGPPLRAQPVGLAAFREEVCLATCTYSLPLSVAMRIAHALIHLVDCKLQSGR